jgi:hypothetical protein
MTRRHRSEYGQILSEQHVFNDEPTLLATLLKLHNLFLEASRPWREQKSKSDRVLPPDTVHRKNTARKVNLTKTMAEMSHSKDLWTRLAHEDYTGNST